jgi:hypothetical protein
MILTVMSKVVTTCRPCDVRTIGIASRIIHITTATRASIDSLTNHLRECRVREIVIVRRPETGTVHARNCFNRVESARRLHVW